MGNVNLQKVTHSFWMDSVPATNYPKLEEEITVDVAIVGGGIVGIASAFLLKEKGLAVAVVDADHILQGTTGHTTSKLTSQHSIIYSKIEKQMGEELARQYAEANEWAIRKVEEISSQNSIQCDFSWRPAYIFTQGDKYIQQLEDEAQAASRAGIKAEIVKEAPLPFPIKAALRFEGQAQFHCLKFLQPLAEKIPGNDSHIFEQTKVTDIEEGREVKVVTNGGNKIKASKVIVATHFPFFDGGGFYFTRMYLERSYIVAATVKEKFPEATFINAEDPSRSLRSTPFEKGELVLFAGENHKTGYETDTNKHYQNLIDFAHQNYTVDQVLYRWSTHDCMTIDGVPLVGNLTSLSPDIYVATGFGKWGMSNGIASAKILTDLITAGDNPWAQVYRPSRFITSASSLKTFAGINMQVARKFITGKLEKGSQDVEIKPGEARVIEVNGQRMGAYRDDEGTLHMVDTTCTHLGCELKWNDAEKSWDCPCHGSRFTYEGKIIEGPAINKLQHVHDKPNEVEVKLFN